MAGLAILLGKGKPSPEGSSKMDMGGNVKFAELADLIDEAISSGGLQGPLKKQFIELMAACAGEEEMEMEESPDSEMDMSKMMGKKKY